jgi:hypothetical protein
VSNVRDTFNRPLIVTRFEDRWGDPLIAVCNASKTENAEVFLELKEPYTQFNRHFFLEPGGVKLIPMCDQVTYFKKVCPEEYAKVYGNN